MRETGVFGGLVPVERLSRGGQTMGWFRDTIILGTSMLCRTIIREIPTYCKIATGTYRRRHIAERAKELLQCGTMCMDGRIDRCARRTAHLLLPAATTASIPATAHACDGIAWPRSYGMSTTCIPSTVKVACREHEWYALRTAAAAEAAASHRHVTSRHPAANHPESLPGSPSRPRFRLPLRAPVGLATI